MATPPRQALLRVLTGPHAGAELLLSEGPNTVGSDDGCDIVLADPQLQSRHAVLFVSAGAVAVEQTSAGPVHVDGQPVSKTPLRPYQCVTVGETHIAIGPANEPWPALTPPALAPLAPAATSASAEQPATDVSTPAPAELPKSAPPDWVTPRRNRRRGAFAVIVAAIVLLAFLLLWNPFGGTPVVATQNDRAALEQQVAVILKQFTAGSDLKIDGQAKTLTVTGYVPTADVRKELATALESVPTPVRMSVSETAALAEAAGRVLKMHQVDLQTAPGEPGEVVVTGVASNPADWAKVKDRVTADVPRIRTLTDRVTGPNQPRSITATPPPPAPAPRITRPTDPPSAAPVPAANGEPAPAPTAVSLAIRSITIGQSRALVLETGERVFEGATLPGGYVVKSIAADRVVLDRMGEESIVSVGGSK